MNVAYVCADPGVPVFGNKGCSVHVQEVVRALGQLGCAVDLFAARYDGPPPADLTDVTFYSLPAPPKGNAHLRERAALAANRDLRGALHRRGPFDLVYERYSLWSYAGMEFAKSAGIPGMLEVNAPLIEEQGTYRELADRITAERVARRTFAAASGLVAVSEGVAKYLASFAETQGRVTVVPNGVNAARFRHDQPAALPRSLDIVTIGFVGTLKPWHGVDGLIAAFARLQQRRDKVRLLIVGDGPERSRLEADVRERGCGNRVMFTGAVEPAAIPGYLAAMDVAVAPYPARDNFYFSPLKVFEYMAAGLPVVASDIGQMPDVIQDGVNGCLYAPGDIDALTEALEQLSAAPDHRARLGQAARAIVLQRHTWVATARRLLKLATARAPAQALEEAVT